MPGTDKKLSIVVELINKTEAQFKRIYQDIENVEKQTANTSRAMREAGAIGAAAFAVAGLGVKKFLSDAGELEQQQVAFTTMLGSAEKAAMMLQNLTDFAAKTPFEVQGIRATAKQLMAMGISSEALIPSLKGLGDVAAGLSQPIDRIAYAFGQVKTQGRLMGGDLMQFTSAGVPLIETLANMFGKTAAEIKNMVSEGKIGFPDVAKAFEVMSGAGGKFENMMSKQAETFNGQLSNLRDNISKTSEIIGTALLPTAKSIAQELLKMTTAVQVFVQKNPELASTVVTVTLSFAALLVTIGLISIVKGPFITAFSLMGSALTSFGKVVTFLRVTTLTQFYTMLSVKVVAVFNSLRASVILAALSFNTLRGAIISTGIGAVAVLAGMAIVKFAELRQLTGSLTNAFKFMWYQTKMSFYDMMGAIVKGFDDLLSKIPGMSDFISDELINGFTVLSDEASAEMDTIAASVYQTTDATTDLAAAVDASVGSMLAGYGDLSMGATDSADAQKKAAEAVKKAFEDVVNSVKSVRDELKTAYEDIGNATKDYQKSQTDENQSYNDNIVQTVVDAQRKIKELKSDLSDAQSKSDNSDEVSKLRKSIKEQQDILTAYKKSGLALDAEIEAAKKRDAMNELDRITYDHEQKLRLMQVEYLQGQVTRLQKLADLQNEESFIVNSIGIQKTAAVNAEIIKQQSFRETLAAQRTGLSSWMAETQNMYTTYVANVKSILSSISGGTTTTTTTSSSSSKKASGARASGGNVQPGRTFLVGERGPEYFTPGDYGSISNRTPAQGITVVFTGNHFTDDRYAEQITKRVVQDFKRAVKVSI